MLLIMMKKENIVLGLLALGSIFLIISGILGLAIKKSAEVKAYPKIEQVHNNLLSLSNEKNEEFTEEEISDELTPEKIPYDPKNPDVTINYYKAFLEKNPNHPDTPAILSALGNLYLSKKVDYETAASYFERIIIEYPDWEGAKGLYSLLSLCYDQLNDSHSKIWLYQEMMKRFPPESQEYQFAKQELGLN